MKKIINLLSLFLTVSSVLTAQVKLDLQYYKSIEKDNGKWTSWPKAVEDAVKNQEFVTQLTIKKIDNEIFNVDFYYGGSLHGMFTDNVVYDPTKTASIRKSNNNDKLTAYRLTGSTSNYIWTENITLAELYANPAKWKTTPNARIYTWEEDGQYGSATLYYGSQSNVQTTAQVAKNFKITFKDVNNKVKGSWTGYPNKYTTAPANSYVQIKVIKDRLQFSFKYYEAGKLVKDYSITYNDEKTKEARKTNATTSIYTIDGSNGDYIQLQNISITSILNDPKSWDTLENAIIYIKDAGKSNSNTRLK